MAALTHFHTVISYSHFHIVISLVLFDVIIQYCSIANTDFLEIATTTSSAPAPTGTASNPFYLYVVNPLNGLRYYLRMNSVGYLVALCPPAPVNVETFAAVFSILGDGSLFTSGSVVDPTAQFAKVPQEQGAPVNGSDLYNYFRFGPDNKVSPTNPNGFTETTFVNGSGTLDWQNVKFNNVVNTGHATFGLNPSATNHIGWIDIIFYGTDTLPGTSSPILLQIQDVGSIPPPSKWLLPTP